MSAVHREGYTRIIPEPHPEAVAWWYVRDYGDGFVFARGGRVARSRQARSQLHACRALGRAEHYEWERRPRFSLAPDGELAVAASQLEEVMETLTRAHTFIDARLDTATR